MYIRGGRPKRTTQTVAPKNKSLIAGSVHGQAVREGNRTKMGSAEAESKKKADPGSKTLETITKRIMLERLRLRAKTNWHRKQGSHRLNTQGE